jgi:hypothetical protein
MDTHEAERTTRPNIVKFRNPQWIPAVWYRIAYPKKSSLLLHRLIILSMRVDINRMLQRVLIHLWNLSSHKLETVVQ